MEELRSKIAEKEERENGWRVSEINFQGKIRKLEEELESQKCAAKVDRKILEERIQYTATQVSIYRENSKSRADCNPEGLFTVIRRVNFSELLLRPIRANPFDKDFNPPLGIEWLLRNDPSGLKLF